MTAETRKLIDSEIESHTEEEQIYVFEKILPKHMTYICDQCIANELSHGYKLFVGEYADEPCSYCGEMYGSRETIEIS